MVREYTKIQFRRDSSGNWITANPTLLAGEIGYETDTQKFKIGTGSLAWNNLPYANRPFVGDGLNYDSNTGVVFADINQSEFDGLDSRVQTLETDPTTKTYVDGEINTLQTNLENADSNLDQKIDIEINDRRNEITRVDGLISDEEAARISGDAGLNTRLSVLEADDQTPDSIAYDIKQESDRAKSAEALIEADVARIDNTSVNVGSFRYEVEQERVRATGAENSLSGRLDTIEGNGSGSIIAAVDAEEQARISADNALGDRIDDEVSDRTSADTVIQDQVDIIKDTTGNVSGSITKAVNDEATLRIAGDNALNTRVSALELDPTTKTYVDAEVATEKSRAEGAEQVLQGEIDAINDPTTGKADLVGGKVDVNQLPDLAISTFLGDVGTEAAMLLLTGESGDWCFRTDISVSYIATGSDLTNLNNWKSITGADSGVVSVNGKLGVVTITKDEFNVDHLENLSGVPAESDDLGSFTGNTIATSSTIKNALQALETTVELKENSSNLNNVARTGAYADLTGQPTDLNQFSNTNTQYITSAGAPVQSVANKTGVVTLVKGDVGLGNVDNTTDLAKPVSTATVNALALKADLESPTFTGTPNAVTAAAGTGGTQVATNAYADTSSAAAVAAAATAYATAAQGALADTAVQPADISNVDNTADADKPVSAATQTALNLKADVSTTYTKTEVDTALGVKADLASPALTGTPTAPTAGTGTNSTQIATTAYADAAVAALNASALRTLLGIVAAADDNASGLATGEMYFNTTSNTYVLVA